MNEFDDRELRDALRRRAGGPTEGSGLEAAHSAVVARAGRVRRRRAAAAGGAAMAGLVAAAVLVIGPGTDSVVTTPGDGTTGSTPVSVDNPADATSPDQTGPGHTGPEQNVIDTARPANTSPSPATTVPSAGPPTGTSPSTTAPPATGTTVNTPPTSPEPTPPTSATAPTSTSVPGPGTTIETYSSAGGSITVGWDGSALSLQDVSAAVGFDSDVEDELADRIRVRFEGEGGDFRIEIRIENGEIVRVE